MLPGPCELLPADDGDSDAAAAGVAAGVAVSGVRVMVVGPFVVSGEYVDERAARDRRGGSSAAELSRRLGNVSFFRCTRSARGARAVAAAGKAAFASTGFRLAERADVEPQQRQPERAQRLVQLRAPIHERLRSSRRFRADTREQPLAGLAQADADVTEVFRLQRDPRL